jgi:hypothetical protein
MKLSDKLNIIAEWLENPENDLFKSAEDNNLALSALANCMVRVASEIKKTANEVLEASELNDKKELTPEFLDELASIAAEFDSSGDEFLQKQASVFDDLLLTLSAPKNAVYEIKKAKSDRIEELKKKYKDIKEQLDTNIKSADSIKAVENSAYYRPVRQLEAPLKTRYCPDHPGAQISRVGDDVWQCDMDGKIYDFAAGFTNMKGQKIPGGGVQYQTKDDHNEGHMIFDTREQRLQS